MSRTLWKWLACLATLLPAGWCLGMGQAEKTTPSSEFPNAQTAVLELFVGKWTVTQDHFDPAGKVSATLKGTEDIAWVLDNHAIRRDYSTRLESTLYDAIGFLAWNDAVGQYDGIWFDNASTAGPTVATGAWDEKTRSMTFAVQGPGPQGQRRQYKVIERFESETVRTATTYLLRNGEIHKTLAVRYERATPCPGKLRIMFDN